MKQLGAQGQSKEVYIFQGINFKIFKKGPKVYIEGKYQKREVINKELYVK